MTAVSQTYLRFGVYQRLEHWVGMLSFTLLAVTGLPQKIQPHPISDAVIARFGGIEPTRVFHHWSAIALVAISIVHVAIVLYRRVVNGTGLSLMPSWVDARQLWHSVRYYVGLTPSPPRFGRYSYIEKAEYWAFVWGTVVMTITGFMLWNPIATARFFPGQFVPAAKAAHGGEALLAVLAIILWHGYHVHIKTFNRSIFTGRLTRHQMEDEHPAELDALPGLVAATGDPERGSVERRRRLAFVPAAAVTVVALFFGLYRFATFEDTALAASPVNPDRQAVVALATRTPTPTRPPAPTRTPTPPPQPTATADPAAMATVTAAAAAGVPGPAVPAATRGAGGPRTTGLGKDVTHAVAGREACTGCHTIGPPPPLGLPASHAGRQDSTCLACHAAPRG